MLMETAQFPDFFPEKISIGWLDRIDPVASQIVEIVALDLNVKLEIKIIRNWEMVVDNFI